MTIKFINRETAKELGLKTYISGTTCKQGHINAERYTSGADCTICKSLKKRSEGEKLHRIELESSLEAKNRNKKKCGEFYQNNKEYFEQHNREYYQSKKEEILETNRKYHKINRVIILERKRKWGQENPDKVAANAAWKRAMKLQRTPPWSDKSLIEPFYTLARKLTKETGIEYHVDHILPLQGELISGLHIHTNLRVIPAFENLSKHNKFSV